MWRGSVPEQLLQVETLHIGNAKRIDWRRSVQNRITFNPQFAPVVPFWIVSETVHTGPMWGELDESVLFEFWVSPIDVICSHLCENRR